MIPTEFGKVMTLLSVTYSQFEVNQTVIEVWYSFFEDVKIDIFLAAVKMHIKNSPFPPTVNELTKLCVTEKKLIINNTLRLMLVHKYFHQGVDDVQALRNFEKANKWVEQGTEPQWLKDDMRKYYKLSVAHNEVKQIG